LTVNAAPPHEQPAFTVNADLAVRHCDSTKQVDDGRQDPALTVNAQLKSQESDSSVNACLASSLTFGSERHAVPSGLACGQPPSDPACSKKGDLAGEDQFQLTSPATPADLDFPPAANLPAGRTSGAAGLPAPFSAYADLPTGVASGEAGLLAPFSTGVKINSGASQPGESLEELLALLKEVDQQPAGADEEDQPVSTGSILANDLQPPAI
jgi:hypothetical protein